MEALPREIVRVLRVFEDVFSERIWDWVQVLVVGAILTPGQRTVAAVLREAGASQVAVAAAPDETALFETLERALRPRLA